MITFNKRNERIKINMMLESSLINHLNFITNLMYITTTFLGIYKLIRRLILNKKNRRLLSTCLTSIIQPPVV